MRLVYQPNKVVIDNEFPKTSGNLILFNNYDDIQIVEKAISGGWGKGTIPTGIYTIGKPSKLQDVQGNEPYKAEGYPWWIGLTAQFKCSRSGFGIHPDGNVPGTMGCISPVHGDIWIYEYLEPLINSGQLKILEVL